ncbi:uncharacterized protein LY89DRAFT_684208 [Mollisia scopiformis]|uniref:A-kinase anchor protein 7-like phosphoesterase domain-containing protein n=1 Tax=Mollisia scopiformis TaxID=149040 RepID=A0A194XEU3_MOLSC|nr:uncharacterized protein LY89DRAFT_684208 [Mollisia scopiformis]KUJ18287.1 hypothetical protein LY89DRAFT_684208 [Mollisia scopiformis]
MPPKAAKAAAPKLTHFLCLPLVTASSRPQLQNSLSSFRENVSKIKTPELPDGIPERAIRPVGTLHLTLGVMSLVTEEKVQGALKLLQEIDIKELLSAPSPVKFSGKGKGKDDAPPGKAEEVAEDVSKPEPLKVTLQGLRSMHNASKTSILYSSPLDPDLRLYQFGSKLRDIFAEAEFMEEVKRKLLLHATVLNTIYAKGVKKGGTGHGKKGRAKLVIDAREILEEYEEFVWMEDVRMEKVAICRMGAKLGEDGEEKYEVEGEIEVPEL